MFLGHVGIDKKLKVPKRRDLSHAQREIEAESVADLVSLRNGITPKSQAYLSCFVQQAKSVDDIDLYQVMRATGQVETVLGLSRSTTFQKREPVRPTLKDVRARFRSHMDHARADIALIACVKSKKRAPKTGK